MEAFSKAVSKDHEGCHPAYVMAVGPFAVNDCRNQKQDYDSVVNDVAVNVGNGNSMIGHKKWLNGIFTLAQNMTDYKSADPYEPDSVFNIVSETLLWFLGRKTFKAFGHSACRTEKSTPEASKKHSKNEHQGEGDETSVYDVFHCCHENQIGRKIPDGNREQQHGHCQRKFSESVKLHGILLDQGFKFLVCAK